jgi:hypothetical protein
MYRLCIGRPAHRGSRGIAPTFHDHGTRRGEVSASPPAALYPRERHGTHCTGGWVGPRAGLDRYGKSHPHRDSIPGPSSPQPVVIPTTLSKGPRGCPETSVTTNIHSITFQNREALNHGFHESLVRGAGSPRLCHC